MIYDVILSNKDNKYFAQIKEWPERKYTRRSYPTGSNTIAYAN
jgi:hypothetical protein